MREKALSLEENKTLKSMRILVQDPTTKQKLRLELETPINLINLADLKEDKWL